MVSHCGAPPFAVVVMMPFSPAEEELPSLPPSIAHYPGYIPVISDDEEDLFKLPQMFVPRKSEQLLDQ